VILESAPGSLWASIKRVNIAHPVTKSARLVQTETGLLADDRWADAVNCRRHLQQQISMPVCPREFGGKSDNLSHLGTSVIYLIAADSTPEPAWQAVIDAGANGKIAVAQALRSRDATSEQTQTLYLETSELVDLQPFWRKKRI
jgi:hypothetical protein